MSHGPSLGGVDLDLGTIRLFLHLVAVSVWVGGQIVLAALVPALRTLGPEAPRTIANRFNRVAWPAFAVAVVTGGWMLGEVHVDDRSTGYQAALLVKLFLVAISGVAAYLHAHARTRAATATWGALGGLSALAAMLFGAILATST